MDLWHYFGDVYGVHIPNTLKKRKSCANETDEAFSTTKRKTSTKDLVCKKFVNTLAKDFIPPNSKLSSLSPSIASENRNVRDSSVASPSVLSEQGGATGSRTNTLLSPLLESKSSFQEELLSTFSLSTFSLSTFALLLPCTELDVICEDERSSNTPDSAVLTDSFAAYNEPAPLERQRKDTTPAAALTEPIMLVELIHAELWNDVSSPGHAEGTSTKSIGSSETYVLTAIDEEEDIWKVEALLAKSKQRKRVVYLVKWKGFPDEANTWQKHADINAELVDDFDAVHLEQGGNHEGVELLDKRVRQKKVEYLVG